MRHDGRLTQWDDARGFGFIEPSQGGDPVFVHIKAFARADRDAAARPRIGDRLNFEILVGEGGRKQARHVVRSDAVGRPSARPTAAPARAAPRARAAGAGTGRRAAALVSLALVGLIGWQLYPRWAALGPGRTTAPVPLAQPAAESTAPPAATNFRCEGRTHCSQMTSCAEATFFLRNCPNTKMDGNRDGVPCEQQWCSSPLAR